MCMQGMLGARYCRARLKGKFVVSDLILPSLCWMLSWFICSVNSFSSIVSVLGTDSEKRRLKFFILFISQCPELLKRQEQKGFWIIPAEQHGDGPSLTFLCLWCQIVLIINKVLMQPTFFLFFPFFFFLPLLHFPTNKKFSWTRGKGLIMLRWTCSLGWR